MGGYVLKPISCRIILLSETFALGKRDQQDGAVYKDVDID